MLQQFSQIAMLYVKLIDKDFLEFVVQQKDITDTDRMYAARLNRYWQNVETALSSKTDDTQLYKSLQQRYERYSELMIKHGAEYTNLTLSPKK